MENEIKISALSIVENIDNSAVNGILQKIAAFQSVVQKSLKSGKDYGIIPGAGNKPTLLKAGAEKINMLFGTNPEYEFLEKDIDFKNGFFNYNIRCTLYKNGTPVSQGVGSCNSMEVKYRYITCNENQLDNYGLTTETAKKKTDSYGNVKYQVPNPEPADKANTILKMAKKRAFVDATLQLASLSDLFTQDLEDMEEERTSEITSTMTESEAKNIKLESGKYKGKTIGELYATKDGKSYLEYIYNGNYMNAKIRRAYELLEDEKNDEAKNDKPTEANDDRLPF